MNKLFLILLLVLGGMVASCTTINTLSVDQILPADMSFPSQVRTVAIVNNLPVPPHRWPDNYTQEDMVEVIDGDGKIAFESLAGHIAEQNYFDRVLICDSALRTNDNSRITSPLKQEEVKKFADDLEVDMIISLDAVMIKATPSIIYTLEEYPQPMGAINATVTTIVRVYLPSRKEALTTLVDKDSIYWQASYINQDEIIENTSVFAATLPVKHLVPSWETVERYYYAGGSVELRDARISIKRDAWDDALASWKKLYNSKSEKKRMYAAFNIALYYELHDDIDEAEKWLYQAMELLPQDQKTDGDLSVNYQMMKEYLLELKKRKEETNKLNLQMSRFKDDF